MQKYFFFLLLATHLTLASAQQAKVEMKQNPHLSANGYFAYPGPLQKQLTPSPKGYAPFYLSHYGRHGSRYLIGARAYDHPFATLQTADSLGKLTLLGKETLRKVALIRTEAHLRDGELTQRGTEQHRQIAERMYRRFPEIFRGATNIDAKSTTVIRCILSMENALQQLIKLNPQLKIRHDASQHDMYYMNQSDRQLDAMKMNDAAKAAYEPFAKRHDNYEGVMKRIFNDENYWRHSIDASAFNDQLYNLASNVQSTELRHSLSLFDIFTADELYDLWQKTNAWWYINFGPSPLNGGLQPYSQRNLLRKIIAEADSCIALPHPGATLRYGHDTMVMPLTCLLNINGYGQQIEDLEQLDDKNWLDYRIFPMACNLQFVFYRSKAHPDDILVKVLQNENEAELPIKTDVAPYYHWNDFKAYCFKILDAYRQ